MRKSILFLATSSILVVFTFAVVYLCYFFGAFDSGGKPRQKFVICFYTSWAQYRDGDGRIQAKDIDPRLCTHITYAHLKVR